MPPPWIEKTAAVALVALVLLSALDAVDDREVDGVAEVPRHGDGAPLVPAGTQALVDDVLGHVELSHTGQHLRGEGERTAGLERRQEGREFGVERRAGDGVGHGHTPSMKKWRLP